jgi:AraC-like DNA-binding protein
MQGAGNAASVIKLALRLTVAFVRVLVRSRLELMVEILALRQQLAVLAGASDFGSASVLCHQLKKAFGVSPRRFALAGMAGEVESDLDEAAAFLSGSLLLRRVVRWWMVVRTA